MIISQPVLVQSLFDEVADIEQGRLLLTPALAGNILMRGDESSTLNAEKDTDHA